MAGFCFMPREVYWSSGSVRTITRTTPCEKLQEQINSAQVRYMWTAAGLFLPVLCRSREAVRDSAARPLLTDDIDDTATAASQPEVHANCNLPPQTPPLHLAQYIAATATAASQPVLSAGVPTAAGRTPPLQPLRDVTLDTYSAACLEQFVLPLLQTSPNIERLYMGDGFQGLLAGDAHAAFQSMHSLKSLHITLTLCLG